MKTRVKNKSYNTNSSGLAISAMEVADASAIKTYYYKLAHVRHIDCYFYAPVDVQATTEQSLLELELATRYSSPKLLFTYYKKFLYKFKFIYDRNLPESVSADDEEPVPIDTDDDALACNPTLKLVGRRRVTALALAMPQRSSTMSGGTAAFNPCDSLQYASLCLYKAVKKMLQYNLSMSKSVKIFGSYTVYSEAASGDIYFVNIDPTLLPNGDLLVSLVARRKPNFMLPNKDLIPKIIDLNFAVYLLPNPIRCHLFDPVNLSQNFVVRKINRKTDELYRLVRLCTGLERPFASTPIQGKEDDQQVEEVLFVKLIPNLKHMNNLTSKISLFIHSINNKKFVYWPWELCLLQLGAYESFLPDKSETVGPLMPEDDSILHNPLSLISEFIDFNISQSNKVQHQALGSNWNPNTFQPPTNISTGGNNLDASQGNTFDDLAPMVVELFNTGTDFPMKSDPTFTEDNDDGNNIKNLEPNEDFKLRQSQGQELSLDLADGNAQKGAPKSALENEGSDDDMEIDDLFGGSDEEEDDSKSQKSIQESIADGNDAQENIKHDSEQGYDDKLEDELFEEFAVAEASELRSNIFKVNKSNDERISNDIDLAPQKSDSKNLNIDITIKTVTPKWDPGSNAASVLGTPTVGSAPSKATYIDIPRDQMTIKKTQTPMYDDPGAPLPIMPTPMINTFGATYGGSSGPGSIPPSSAPYTSNEGKNAQLNNQTNQNAVKGSSSSTEDGIKSAFSPILFNPIIENNIDTKYGKGGKFYVDKEVTPLAEKKIMRATSVSGHEIPLREERSFKSTVLGGMTYPQEVIEDDSGNDENSYDAYEDEEMSSDEDEDSLFVENTGNFGNGASSNFRAMNKFSKSPPLILNTDNDHLLDSFSSPMGGNSRSRRGSISMTNQNIYQENQSPLRLTGRGALQEDSAVKDSISSAGTGNSFPGISPISYEPSTAMTTHSNPPMSGSPGSNLQATNLQFTSFSPEKREVGGSIISEDESKTETSNYLPLLLRSINVSTIPEFFMTNNLLQNKETRIIEDFSIMEEEENIANKEFGDFKENEMVVTDALHLDILLEYLSQNIVYDYGLLEPFTSLKLINDDVDFAVSEVDMECPPPSFESAFLQVFPYCYKVNLIEFINNWNDFGSNEYVTSKDSDINGGVSEELDFLNDLGDDTDPKFQFKKLNEIEYDTIEVNSRNKDNFEKYRTIMDELIRGNNFQIDQNSCFKLPVIKAKVKKFDDIINFDYLGVNFWRMLSLSPLNEPKNFQILLISEQHLPSLFENHGVSGPTLLSSTTSMFHYNSRFLNNLIQSYSECNLGNISKLNVRRTEEDNGMLLVKRDRSNTFNDTYKEIHKQLELMVEQIKLDLINKTNKFEFNRPLLLLFVDFNQKCNSVLQISKIFKNFKLALDKHQLPLVQFFVKIIPADFIIKKKHNEYCLKMISNYSLSKLSMMLYNMCPDTNRGSPTNFQVRKLYTNIVQEPPRKIQFKFLGNSSNNLKNSVNNNDDIFLHLAYERSIDKNWVSAAWLDPLGVVTHTKTWYCPVDRKIDNGNTQNHLHNHFHANVYEIGQISEEIWRISNELFKLLNNEIIKKTNVIGGKKFLVLTRINSIIPDDELIHWKKLSVNHKDISLIVLSVNRAPKLVFERDLVPGVLGAEQLANSVVISGENKNSFSLTKMSPQQQLFSRTYLMSSQAPSPNLGQLAYGTQVSTGGSQGSVSGGGSGGFLASPSNFSLHSPQQFANMPQNFLSPMEKDGGSVNGSVSNGGGLAGQGSSDGSHHGPLVSGSAATPNGNQNLNHGHNASTNHGSGTGNSNLSGLIDGADLVVTHPESDVIGIIPKLPFPPLSSPTRLAMMVGYLVKPFDLQRYLVYEVCLFSCSAFWSLPLLMHVLLEQYQKLIVLNDILGLREFDGYYKNGGDEEKEDNVVDGTEEMNIGQSNFKARGLVPWHITAVGKTLDYLVHVLVEE